jgi:hypothetical protein
VPTDGRSRWQQQSDAPAPQDVVHTHRRIGVHALDEALVAESAQLLA